MHGQLLRGVPLRQVLQKPQLEYARPIFWQVIAPEPLDEQTRLGRVGKFARALTGGLLRNTHLDLAPQTSGEVDGAVSSDRGNPSRERAALERAPQLRYPDDLREQLMDDRLTIHSAQNQSNGALRDGEVVAVAPLEDLTVPLVEADQPVVSLPEAPRRPVLLPLLGFGPWRGLRTGRRFSRSETTGITRRRIINPDIGGNMNAVRWQSKVLGKEHPTKERIDPEIWTKPESTSLA